MLFRQRIADVARWPAWEVDLLDQYLAVQPAPDERIELAIAQLHATYAQLHHRPGAAAIKLSTFLPYADPWTALARARRYTSADLEIMKAFGL